MAEIRAPLEIDPSAIAGLSIRERQVLAHAAEGFLDKQIGAALGVSLNTLRTYWKRIRGKLGDHPRSALAVAYTRYVASTATGAHLQEPEHDWEIDLKRDVIRRVSSRPVPVKMEVGAEMPIEELLSTFHPEDEQKTRTLLVAVRRGHLSAFHFSARMILPEGMALASAFVQVLRDETGEPFKVIGRRVPMLDVASPPIAHLDVGYWTLDLEDGAYQADAELCRIFDVDPNSKNLRDMLLSRFHPDEVDSCRSIVAESVRDGKERVRSTRRLYYDDGSIRWATLDLRIEYEGAKAVRALGTVMVFESELEMVMA